MYFNSENTSDEKLKAKLRNTDLTAWFELNKNPTLKVNT